MSSVWVQPPENLCLSEGEVHLWQAKLDLRGGDLAELRESLSEDEKQRADRFFKKSDRAHFTAARGILRNILGRYLGQEASQLQFSYSSRGKPFLDEEIQFNVSHSHGLALYAIAPSQTVGIDLEAIRPLSILELAKRFFSDREYRLLASLPSPSQPSAFFQIWTAKEAYLKATGEGLIGLSEVEISLDPLQLLSQSSEWSLYPLTVNENYKATLAVAGSPLKIQTWQWD